MISFDPNYFHQYTVIVDLDGTVADCSKRQSYVLTNPKNWAAFNAGIPHDDLYEDICVLVRGLYFIGMNIVYCTGRSEPSRNDSVEWLTKKANLPYKEGNLYMRKKDDYRCDTIIKAELLEQIKSDGHENILFVLDDRQKVVNMWRSKGIRCLQVQPGDF